jgi:amidase
LSIVRYAGVRGGPSSEYPFGATFAGRAWSEPVLLRLAYAFEQATKARRMPSGYPALTSACREAAGVPPG